MSQMVVTMPTRLIVLTNGSAFAGAKAGAEDEFRTPGIGRDGRKKMTFVITPQRCERRGVRNLGAKRVAAYSLGSVRERMEFWT